MTAQVVISDKWCPSGSVLEPILLTIFINDIDSGIQGALSKSVDETKLSGEVGTVEDRDAIQKDMNILERWAHVKLMIFNKAK